MGSQTPFARLTGTWLFYVAAASTAIPALDGAPGGSWTQLGPTEGDQGFQYLGGYESFSDNESTGTRKHVRPVEGFVVNAILANITLEDLARTLSMATSAVISGTSGAYNVSRLPFKRGFVPTRYALLARGGALQANNRMSGYMAGEAQIWIPQGVFGGEPTLTFSKAGSPGVGFDFMAEVDSSQSAGEEFGYFMMRTS